MTALLPLLALAVPGCVLMLARVLSVIPGLRRVEPMAGLALIWGLLAPLALVAVALVGVSVLAERAFLVFLPGILLLAAAGLTVLVPRRLLPVGAALVAALFAGSVVFNRMGPNSPRDYQALAAALAAELQPGDLILLRKRDWADTPLLYYLSADGVVESDWAEAAAASAGRVWIVTWPDPGYTFPEDGRRDAVAGWTRAGEITARRALAELYTRTP